MLYLLYLLLGTLAGFLSGLLGIGGGLIIVPGLLFIFSWYPIIPQDQVMHVIMGTSLACAFVNLISSARIHAIKKAVRWEVFKQVSLGIVIGALILGPIIMLHISSGHLKVIFGIFCLAIAAQILFKRKNVEVKESLPNKLGMFFVGTVIGLISTLLGIAGGVLMGTFLNYCQMNIRQVIGTSSVVGLIIAFTGSIGLMIAGHHATNLPHWSTGFIYWPAFICIALPSLIVTPFGAKLTHKLPTGILKKIFALFVLLTGLKMLF